MRVIDKIQILMMKEGWSEKRVLRLALRFIIESNMGEELLKYLEDKRGKSASSM